MKYTVQMMKKRLEEKYLKMDINGEKQIQEMDEEKERRKHEWMKKRK